MPARSTASGPRRTDVRRGPIPLARPFERLPTEEPLRLFMAIRFTGGVARYVHHFKSVVLQKQGGFESAGEVWRARAGVHGLCGIVLGVPVFARHGQEEPQR